jgi:hypothetical protein
MESGAETRSMERQQDLSRDRKDAGMIGRVIEEHLQAVLPPGEKQAVSHRAVQLGRPR